jgi:hypothetical protein
MPSVLAVIALDGPDLLAGLNRQWIKLGIAPGKVANPIALGVLFCRVLTLIGVLMRLMGIDPLRLKLEFRPTLCPCKPPGPPPDSMTNQF